MTCLSVHRSGPKYSKHCKLLGEKPSRKKVPLLSQKQQLFKIDGWAPAALDTKIILDQVNCRGPRSCVECVSLFPCSSITRKALREVFQSSVASCLNRQEFFAPTALSVCPAQVGSPGCSLPAVAARVPLWRVHAAGMTHSSSFLS